LIPSVARTTTAAASSTDENTTEEKNDSSRVLVLENEDNVNSSRVQIQTIRHCLLQVYLKFPMSLSTTTWRWLRRLGFLYDARKKSFFVDGHKRPNVVFKRNEFCTLYLTSWSLAHIDGYK
jgi:hypothetical protein